MPEVCDPSMQTLSVTLINKGLWTAFTATLCLLLYGYFMFFNNNNNKNVTSATLFITFSLISGDCPWTLTWFFMAHNWVTTPALGTTVIECFHFFFYLMKLLVSHKNVREKRFREFLWELIYIVGVCVVNKIVLGSKVAIIRRMLKVMTLTITCSVWTCCSSWGVCRVWETHCTCCMVTRHRLLGWDLMLSDVFDMAWYFF